MTTSEEALDLAAIQARADAAMDEVARICDPGERFRMSIPADPKRDSDLLLMDALTDTAALVARVRALVAERDAAQANPRDEFHTMEELYDYRMLYNALAFNAWAQHETFPVVKSWRHSDGELCFGGGWFIVVATLPGGLVSNHYKAENWDLFHVPEGTPPEYDGHTPQDVADRLRAILAQPDDEAASE